MSLLHSKRFVSTAVTRRCLDSVKSLQCVTLDITAAGGDLNNTQKYASSLSAATNSSNSCQSLGFLWQTPFQTRQFRFKHAAKKGLHLQKLDEMAHSSEREAAEERRKKKKEKSAARKGKKGASPDEDEGTHANATDEDDESDEEHNEDEQDASTLPEPAAVKKRMLMHVAGFKEYLKGVRGLEPTPDLFDDIMVTNAYGSGTGSAPLKSVAQVVISSPTLAMATCFDPSTAKAVSLAIRDKLELNPQVEEGGGGSIKIPLPRISMESRQQTAAAVQKRAENYRQRIRKNRRTALDIVKQGVAGKLEGVSKDDAFRVQQEVEAVTETVINELNQVAEKKHKDIFSV